MITPAAKAPIMLANCARVANQAKVIKKINDILIADGSAYDLIQVRTAGWPQHPLIMIADDIGDRIARFCREFRKRFKNIGVSIDTVFKYLQRHSFRDDRKKMSFIVALKEIEEVAVDNELYFVVTINAGRIEMDELHKLFPIVEFFQRVDSALS